ncbi:MAG: hypothetical protein A2583_02970 [Bdellovibrionales bacterium RIFOXYD1_FULL_53_11]|nr:MAG: hypothetical protein A2583_02970 [Bdellovibrionales bacterium RIFOXYD1_FULL_53_11]
MNTGLLQLLLLASVAGAGADESGNCPRHFRALLSESATINATFKTSAGTVRIPFVNTDRSLCNMYYGYRWNDFGLSGEYSFDSLDLAHLKSRKVLDAGGGAGGFVRDLRALGINAEGFDLRYARLPREKIPPGMFAADAVNIPRPDRSYDVIFSTQSVLTYNTPAEAKIKTLLELRRLLRPDGIIKLSPVNYVEMHRLLAKLPDLEIKYIRPVHSTSLRRFDPAELKRLRETYSLDGEAVIGFKKSNSYRPPAWKVPHESSHKFELMARIGGVKSHLELKEIDIARFALRNNEVAELLKSFARKGTGLSLEVRSLDGIERIRILPEIVQTLEQDAVIVFIKSPEGRESRKLPLGMIETIIAD